MNTGKCYSSVIIIVLVFMFFIPLYSQEQNTLGFDEVLDGIEDSPDIRDALLVYERTLLEEKLAALENDLEINFTPSLKSQFSETGSFNLNSVNGSLGLTLFTGRNDLQEEKYIAAGRKSETAVLILEQARNEAIQKLYEQYSDLWLLQKESVLLEMDAELAKKKFDAILELYAGGAVNLGEVESLQEDLSQAEDEVIRNIYEQRLAWLNLQKDRGITWDSGSVEIPELEDFLFEIEDPAHPSDLDSLVWASSGELSTLEDQLAGLEDSITRIEKSDWDLSVKPSFSYGDHDIGLSYGFQNRALSMSWGFPVDGLFNETSGILGTNLSVSLSYTPGKNDDMNAGIYKMDLLRQEQKIEESRLDIALKLRTAYQKFLESRETLNKAERDLLRLERLRAAVTLRREAGQALSLDVQSAELACDWGEWKINSARIQLQKAYMSLAFFMGAYDFL